MKKKFVSILVLTLLIVTTVLLVLGLMSENVISESNSLNLQLPGVTFNQVDYLWEKSTFTNSNTGEIVVDVETLNAATGMISGYINVYSVQGWVIQNLPIIQDFPYSSISTYFDLGSAGDVTSIDVYVEASVDPYQRFPNGPMTTYPIFDTELNAEGAEEPMTILRPQPPTPGFPGPGQFNPIGTNIECTQVDHPNIHSASNQCVSIAWANNFQYLEDKFGVYVPHDHIEGVDGVPSNSLVGQLDILMQRSSVSRENGSGTNYSTSLDGGLKYAWTNSLQIDFKHQGLKGDQDVSYESYTSYGQGKKISFDFILEEVCKGSAIEFSWSWITQTTGKKKGGHMVQLVTAGIILDVPYIIYLDDGSQISEKNPNGDSKGLGPPKMRYLIDTDNDGMYNVLKEPETPPGFPPELKAIYVQTAHNQPPEKPSMVTGGGITMKVDVEYEFTTSTTDPNGQPIWYLFSWGDLTTSGWVGPFDSGQTASAKKSWGTEGLYEIRAKAKDIFDAESEWSDIRIGVVPKTRTINTPFLTFLENHPNLFPILQFLL